MKLLRFLFGKKVPSMTIDEVVMDMEIRWKESGITDSTLIDFMENIFGEYMNRMKKSDYETLRDAILFDWEENTVCEFV